MKGIRVFFCFLVCLLIVACETPDPAGADKEVLPKTRCIDGVTYIFFKGQAGYYGYGYMSVKFNKDGTVATCGQ